MRHHTADIELGDERSVDQCTCGMLLIWNRGIPSTLTRAEMGL